MVGLIAKLSLANATHDLTVPVIRLDMTFVIPPPI